MGIISVIINGIIYIFTAIATVVIVNSANVIYIVRVPCIATVHRLSAFLI